MVETIIKPSQFTNEARNRLKALARQDYLRVEFVKDPDTLTDYASLTYGGDKMARIHVDTRRATLFTLAHFPYATVRLDNGYSIQFDLNLKDEL
jgi:hypothetical protein